VRKIRRLGLSLVLAVLMLVGLTVPALAAGNPTVAITVTAQVISITNDKDAWAIGTVAVDTVVYFSTNGAENDVWSTITNTGSVTVDVKIQGTNIEGGAYDWTLATAAGNQTYSLYANLAATPTVYDVEVKNAPTYSTITAAAGLTKTSTNKWSMKFTAPNEFNASDAGAEKTATVTLVASKHT
jgi:hypothetical protein